MSQLFVETIDESNFTVSIVLTSSVFTFLPLYIPWPFPPPERKFRISFSGDSTSFIENIVAYWRPEVSITNISNYTDPSNKFNLGDSWNYPTSDFWVGAIGTFVGGP